jgi:dephospho-CoA kinase
LKSDIRRTKLRISDFFYFFIMLKIGLTGGIGSGKTTVAKIFEVLGIPVYYADDTAKYLMNTDSGIMEAIKSNFGEDSYTDNGLNRPLLASRVFGNKEKLEILNAIVHPATLKHADAWMQEQTSPYIIKEAALIFESGSEKMLDAVIGVSSPETLRIKRVIARDGITEADIMKRMKGQLDEAEKIKRCNYVIYNDEQQLLIPQVTHFHEIFLSLSK